VSDKSKELKKYRMSSAIITLTILGLIFSGIIYWRTSVEDQPGDYKARKANYQLEDGKSELALKGFQDVLAINPEHVGAHMGMATTYMQMKKEDLAMQYLNKTIELDPELPAAYANKGILLDRQGYYREAIGNYVAAIRLDPEIVDGPGFIWRFMRNISDKPPTILDRANYLAAELKKPVADRQLSVPEKDSEQRMYKLKQKEKEE
jgi:tetratricopeptide (TPR) repeat protein